ncbi:MAG: SpoIIE family protein phosphatase [Actinomycetota bacterium]
MSVRGNRRDTDTERRVQRLLTTHYSVTQVLADSETLVEATPRILQAIGESLGWEVAGLWQADRTRTHLWYVDAWSAPGFQAPEFVQLSRETIMPLGIGLPGRVLASGEPAWIPDVGADDNFPRAPAALAEGLHAAFGFPIALRDRIYGVIESFTVEVLELDRELLDLLRAIGNQIGQFIQNKESQQFLRESEALKTAMVESAIDCVISIDHRGNIVEFNPAAEETFGYARKDVIGKVMADLIIPARYRQQHREGLTRYLETGEGPILNKRIEIVAQRADGTEFPVELAVVPADVPPSPFFTGYLRDITQKKQTEAKIHALLQRERVAREEAERATRRLWQLQHITEAALSHLSLDELLEELLARIGETLKVEIAVMLLMDDEREYLTVRATLGLDKSEEREGIVVGRGVAGRIAATGRPEFVSEISDVELALAELRELGTRALGGVPLIADEEVIGVLMVGTTRSRAFSEDDELLLRLTADRLSIAIEHARLYEREHNIAVALQRSLLLSRLPEIPNVSVATRYLPGGAGVEVGGDWYDVIALPGGQVGLVIGDVAGRGTRAATVMGQLRNTLRAYAFEGAAPTKVLSRVNRMVNSFERTGMATVTYMVFNPETGHMSFASAGHPPPLLRRVDDTIEYLYGGRSIPLGVMMDAEYEEDHMQLTPGDVLMLYTDGLVESRTAGLEEGMQRLSEAVAGAPHELEDLCEHVLREISGGKAIPDDVAFVALKYLAKTEPLRLRLPAAPPSVAILRRAVEKWLGNIGAGEEVAFEMTVACGEAISNSIEHAYGLGEGDVEVRAEESGGVVTVTVRDYGHWRPPRETDRGRGLELMRSLVDEVNVTPAADGSRVQLVRRLRSKDADAD